MNFVKTFKEGQIGVNKGLFLGQGVLNIHNAVNGLQKGRLYVIASSPKVGKSTFLNYAFIINPIIDAIKRGIKIKYYYFSLEMSRIEQEFLFATYFLYHDHGIKEADIDTIKDGLNTIPLSPEFLMGRKLDDNGEIIKVNKYIEGKLIEVYKNRIIKLFGEHDEEGKQISEGVIEVIEASNNPTGIYNYILEEAGKKGKFLYKQFGNSSRVVGYIPNDDNEFIVVCFDHMRKVYRERGFDLKQSVDKLAEYFVFLRNILKWTFIPIIHLNRTLTDINRFKMFDDRLYPDSDMVKDTGNLAEDCDYLFTMFNPNDDKYNLNKHFGLVIRDSEKNVIYENLKTIHLVESRYCEYPQHFRVNMLGNLKAFLKFKEN